MKKKTQSLSKSSESASLNRIKDYIVRSINEADLEATATRVVQMRMHFPDESPEKLAHRLIKNKCFQTGTVGAVTSAASMIPGLGTFATLVFGVAADIGMTFKLQAEMVLEIAAAYQHELSDEEKQHVILVVTGVSAGVNQVAEVAGKRIAQLATEKLAEKSVLKAIPMVGVAASAGINITSTYIIGQRAKAYFSLSPAETTDWSESARAIAGVDERVIIEWLVETTEQSWNMVRSSAENAAGAVIVAGQSAGEVVAINAQKVNEIVNAGYKGTIEGISSTSGKMVKTSREAKESVITTANTASKSTLDTANWIRQGIISGATAIGDAKVVGVKKTSELAVSGYQQAANKINAVAAATSNTVKKTGQEAVKKTKKTGQIATRASQGVAKNSEALAGNVVMISKKTQQGVTSTTKKASKIISNAGHDLADKAGSVSNSALKIVKPRKRNEEPAQTTNDDELNEPINQAGE